MFLLFVMFAAMLAYCILTSIRFEKVLAAAVGILVLLCYVLAMFKQLQLFSWLVYASSFVLIATLFSRVVRRKVSLSVRTVFQYAITPGFVAFLLLLVLYAVSLKTHVVNATDDFNYWAVEVKSLYWQNGFVNAYQHLSPRFMSYTPGMQLFQWIALQAEGGFSEGTLFVALAVFNTVFLMPLVSEVTWKKAYSLPLYVIFLIVGPTLLFRDTFAMLRVDATLGVCLGCAMCQAWSLCHQTKPRLFDVFSFALTLCMLSLVKQIGIAWALLPISMLFVFGGKKSLVSFQRILPIALVGAVFLSWQVFTAVNQLNGVHDTIMTDTVNNMVASTWQPPKNLPLLPGALWGALTYTNRAMLVNSPTTSLVYPSMFGWLVLMIIAPVAVSFFSKSGEARSYRRLSLWMLCCAALLLLAFVVIFLTAFAPEFDSFIGDDLARLQYLLERYLGAFLLGGALLGVYLVQQSNAPLVGKWLGVVCGLVLLVNWGQIGLNLLPSEYVAVEPTDIYIYQEENFWVSDVDALDDPQDAIILYGINPTPLRPERLQYAVAPVKIITFYGDIDSQAFVDLLRNYHITHVISMDDSNPTYLAAQTFIEDGYMDTYTLYTVRWEGDRPILEYT